MVCSVVPGIFTVNSCAKVPLWDVHAHFDCAGSHKMVWNVVFRDRCKTWDTFLSARHAWHFRHVAKMLAGACQNERCFSEAIFRGDVLEGSKIVLWNCRHLWFGTWWWFRVAGAGLRMPWSHFSWQAQYFVDIVDLDKRGWNHLKPR